jgi:hypothetical protein
MTLTPQIDGTAAIRSTAGQFVEAFQRRVAAGLLTGQPHPRSNYRVVDAGMDRLRVRAADWWTAISVGLNEMELRLAQPGVVHYRVRYWRWATYAIGLCGILGLIGLVLLLTLDVRGYFARNQAGSPFLSIEQNLIAAWTMVIFWGGIWPWLLIALHKRSLRRLVAQIIGEVDAQGLSK